MRKFLAHRMNELHLMAFFYNRGFSYRASKRLARILAVFFSLWLYPLLYRRNLNG